MKKRTTILLLCIIASIKLCAQKTDSGYWEILSGETIKILEINQTFKSNSEILLADKQINELSSIYVDGYLRLNSDSSFVRITVEDINGEENLILEANYLTFGENAILNQYFEETGYMKNYFAKKINISIIDAELFIQQFKYVEQVRQKRVVQRENEMYIKYYQQDKIDRINQNIKNKNLKWVAKETDISKLTFQKKKELFAGSLPNLYCFEYYGGGIFEYPHISKKNDAGLKTESFVIDNFDWRNRHGRNWNTSVKQQVGGTCWAYTATGVTEAAVNLYFNRQINEDLSEANLVVCNTHDYTYDSGGNGDVLNDIKNNGVVDESCYPTTIQNFNGNCGDTCVYPNERVKIQNVYRFSQYTTLNPEEELKKMIISNGPCYMSVRQWQHAMVLCGFGKIKENDTVYTDSSAYFPIVITNGDSLIGKTYWIVKNSWGTHWGNGGYGFIVDDLSNMNNFYFVEYPIISKKYRERNRLCEDRDGDGYYNWGLGSKPSTCPDCAPDDEDGDDSDSLVGPMDEYGNLLPITPYTHQDSIVSNRTEVWEDTVALCGNLTIGENGTVAIIGNGILIMPNYSQITVENGGKLYVVSGSIKNFNIFVKSGGELYLNNNAFLTCDFNDEIRIEEGGVVEMENGVSIEMVGNSTMY